VAGGVEAGAAILDVVLAHRLRSRSINVDAPPSWFRNLGGREAPIRKSQVCRRPPRPSWPLAVPAELVDRAWAA